MDFIHPGYHYPPESKIENPSTKNPPQSQAVTGSRLESWLSSPSHDSARSLQNHWKNMRDLRKRNGVHSSRSLDHYCHQRASNKELQDRVGDQVLTRFMQRQPNGGDTSSRLGEHGYLKMFRSMCSNAVKKLRLSTLRSRSSGWPVGSLEEGQKGGEGMPESVDNTDAPEHAARNTQNIESPSQILVVPQLWLWKFDSE